MPNILFLSDNALFTRDLINQIETELPDYKVFASDDGETIFDLALLDGKALLSEFRLAHRKVPALILEPTDSEEYTADNLDKFIYKPLVLEILFNEIKSIINVFANSDEGILHFGNYELRPSAQEIIDLKNNQAIKLTEREVSIIRYLYKAKEHTVSKAELLQNVWGYSADATTHTIETHMYRLRKKIEQEKTVSPLILQEDGNYRLNE